MNCPECNAKSKAHGKDRKGNQRYSMPPVPKNFPGGSSEAPREYVPVH